MITPPPIPAAAAKLAIKTIIKNPKNSDNYIGKRFFL